MMVISVSVVRCRGERREQQGQRGAAVRREEAKIEESKERAKEWSRLGGPWR